MKEIKLINKDKKVLFSYKNVNNNIQKTLEEAVRLGVNLDGLEIKGEDLSYSFLTGIKIKDANFEGCTFLNSSFNYSHISNSSFNNCKLSFSNMYKCNLDNVEMKKIEGYGLNMSKSKINNCCFNDSLLTNESNTSIFLEGAEITECSFENALLPDTAKEIISV